MRLGLASNCYIVYNDQCLKLSRKCYSKHNTCVNSKYDNMISTYEITITLLATAKV